MPDKLNNRPLEDIQADIDRARAWARQHFNADAEDDTLLGPPTFLVKFPAPDEMTVNPRAYGRILYPTFTYKLAWVSGSMVWTANNPLTGQKMSGLKVGEVENA